MQTHETLPAQLNELREKAQKEITDVVQKVITDFKDNTGLLIRGVSITVTTFEVMDGLEDVLYVNTKLSCDL